MHDLILRNGRIVDGTGVKPSSRHCYRWRQDFCGGERTGSAKREIDAAGKLVMPGFVDAHTHYDGQVTWDSELAPSSWHGVTTVVMGNCGVGFAPVRPAERDFMIQVMEGVEEILAQPCVKVSPGPGNHSQSIWISLTVWNVPSMSRLRFLTVPYAVTSWARNGRWKIWPRPMTLKQWRRSPEKRYPLGLLAFPHAP